MLLHSFSDFYFYIAIFALAFFIVLVTTPSIIFTSIKHQLFDDSDLHRKNHKRNISNLGGVAIFSSFVLSVLLFSAVFNFQQAIFLMISSIILFATGLKDDVYGIGTGTKLILNIIVAAILVFLGGFKLTSFYGVFDIQEMNVLWSSLFSMLLIIFLNNAFNLIDGIDGLAGTIGVLVNMSFGLLFAFGGFNSYAFIAFAISGAICGFLYYNFSPAKIFMGDTGALIIGMVSVSLAIKFIELNRGIGVIENHFESAPAIAVGILIVPVFDSLRIFFIRIVKGRSPFKGDRNHVHHRLQSVGLSDTAIVVVLGTVNVSMIVFTFLFQQLGNFALISILIVSSMFLNAFLTYRCGKRRTRNYKIADIFRINNY